MTVFTRITGSAVAERGALLQSADNGATVELNHAVDFDSPFFVFQSRGAGTIVLTGSDTPDGGPYAPSVMALADGSDSIDDESWQPVDGYSGQYRYSGPVMHVSEYLGGGMARDLLAGVMGTGWFVVVAVESDTCDDFTLYGECGVSMSAEDAADVHECSSEPAGWMLLHKPAVFK